MNYEKIIQELNSRFAQELPEFYKRRVIFWYDEDGEHLENVKDIELDNATVVVLSDDNMFTVKKLITSDDTSSNFLIYRPFDLADEDNWLLNVELYSEEYRSDLISSYIDEMKLKPTLDIRKCVKQYSKFFNSKERRKKFTALVEGKDVEKRAYLHMAVMATIVGIKEIRPNAIIKAVLSAGLVENPLLKELKSYGADQAFVNLVYRATGYIEEDMEVKNLAMRMLVTASTRTVDRQCFLGLDEFVSDEHVAYCSDFISEWLYSTDNHILYDFASEIEVELRMKERLARISSTELASLEIFPVAHEVILAQLMEDSINGHMDAELIKSIIDKRRATVWADHYANYYDAMYQVANMIQFKEEYSAKLNIADSRKLWKLYTDELYMMDTYYRMYHLAFVKTLTESVMELEDKVKQVTDIVEAMYSNWFLKGVGETWSNLSEDELKEYGVISDIPEQVNFYRDKVKNSDNRVFVIISDALRYEVASSLSEELQQENQAKVDLKSMQGILPTITKFGMGALLPHKELTMDVKGGKVSILSDGVSTDSSYRRKVLEMHNPESVALQYKNIVKMKRADRTELVKGKDVVYIYHDVIDETSHTSDTAVFGACEDCIAEIKNLVKIIVNDFNGSKIFITADHGFLYTYNPLQENDKVDKSNFKGHDIECGKRHVIVEKGCEPDYLMPIKFISEEYDAYVPRESIRIKVSGGGQHFVHGGASLQEMVVPLIEYSPLRKTSKEYMRNKDKYDTKPVELNLLSSNKKISNLIFAIKFSQRDAVGANRKATNYTLYFIDERGTQISDTKKIIADKTSSNEQERIFNTTFSLKSLQYDNTKPYYLVIQDESGELLPQKEEFNIDIAFMVDAFDDFM